MIDKAYLSIEEQITRLKERGLIISDEGIANYLLRTGFSTQIDSYSTFFYSSLGKERYIKGTEFKEIYALYEFNNELCNIYIQNIMIAERTLRMLFSDFFVRKHSPTGYWDPMNFQAAARKCKNDMDEKGSRYSRWITKIRAIIDEENRYDKQRLDDSWQYKKNKEEDIPIWVLINKLSFGLLRDFYNIMLPEDKHEICNMLQIQFQEFESGLAIMNSFRNVCAHSEKIIEWYYPRSLRSRNGGHVQHFYGVYAVTMFLKKLLPTYDYIKMHSELTKCFDSYHLRIRTINLNNIITKGMRFPKSDNLVLDNIETYSEGVILRDYEFMSLIKRYIIPMIPYGSCEPERDELTNSTKGKRSLVEYFPLEETLKFRQSRLAAYAIRIKVPKYVVDKSLVERLESLLTNILYYLQIIWDSEKAQYTLNKQETSFLFEINSEMAYQMALCQYLCGKDEKKSVLYNKRQKVQDELEKNRKNKQKMLMSHDEEGFLLLKKEEALIIKQLDKVNMDISRIHKHCALRRETLYSVLSCLDRWTLKTYEGKYMSFGIIINDSIRNNNQFNYIEFLQEDYSATVSDGVYSSVEIQANGQYRCHIATDKPGRSLDTIPYPYQGFAQQCDKNKIGVLLTENREIIIIKDRKMICSKNNGHWTYNMYEYAIEKIRKYLNFVPQKERDIAVHAIYRTLVDVSYSHGGACIAIARDPINANLLRMTYPTLLNLKDKDYVLNEIANKRQKELNEAEQGQTTFRLSALQGLAGNYTSFYKLDPFFRRELVEMDGSLIFGPAGEIHAVASIVNTNGASIYSGARTTAAVRLSKYGLGIKVSQDGYIKFYEAGEETLSI